MIKLVTFLSIFLPAAVAIISNADLSAVITGTDVINGLTATQMKLAAGQMYRAYAVYASSAANDNYVSKITIRGADGTQFTVADLAKPKAGTTYVLDETRLLKAPITITDTNTKPPTGFLIGTPYTIYFITDNVMVSPVLSAQYITGKADSSLAKIGSSCSTILSAEMSMLLSEIDGGSANKVHVMAAGSDALAADNSVLEVTKDTAGSSVMISAPIATLYYISSDFANFTFTLNKEGKLWTDKISPGASTTFLSNGWFSVGESYNVDYANEYVRSRTYDFSKEVDVTFNPVVGNYYPDSGDSVKLTCTKGDGKSTVYDCGELAGSVKTDRCQKIGLNVAVGKQTITGPRFKVEIQSANGAFSSSIIALLITSLLGGLIH